MAPSSDCDQAGGGIPVQMAPKSPRWMTRNVLALSLVSLLTDSATEMAIPLLPVFLTTVLGAGATSLGLIEGAADSLASLLKLASGRLADRFGRNHPFVAFGYALSSLARPLLALAQGPGQVLAVRLADRTGKGIRSSPRDALLATSVPQENRGAAFGFNRAMDHLGAVVGPLVAVAILSLWTHDLRMLFACTLVPGLLAVAAVIFGVREEPRETKSAVVFPELTGAADPGAGPTACERATGAKASEHTGADLAARRRFVGFLAALSLFTLGNASDTFLLLKAGTSNAPLTTLPLLWMALHLVKASSSLLGGRLSDRIGTRPTIVCGWLVYIAVYAAFAVVDAPLGVGALFVVYGLYHGLSEAPEKALVAGLAKEGTRGTAFGWYNLVIGIFALPAGLLFGGLWDRVGQATAFGVSAGLAALALVVLLLFVPGGRDAPEALRS
jgi:MFS family permease